MINIDSIQNRVKPHELTASQESRSDATAENLDHGNEITDLAAQDIE